MWTPRLTKLGPKVEGRSEHLEDAWRATPTHLIASALQTGMRMLRRKYSRNKFESEF